MLVNGVNHHVAAADALLQRFAFVPQARLDDVMVSYATPGGGVGPHVDSLRRVSAAGPRPAAVARSKASDIWRTPATCCTCRRACATTAWRSSAASPTRSAFARRAAPSSAPPSSTGCTSAACREADYRDPGLDAGGAAGRAAEGDGFVRRRAARPHPLVAQRRRTIPRRIPERAQAARGFQPRPRAAGAARARSCASMPRRACSTAAGGSSSTARASS